MENMHTRNTYTQTTKSYTSEPWNLTHIGQDLSPYSNHYTHSMPRKVLRALFWAVVWATLTISAIYLTS